MKRVVLFLLTNVAIMVVLGIVTSVLGLNRYLTAGGGLNLGTLLGFALVMGFGGSFISLWMSKWIAKWTTGARVITNPSSHAERWLVDTVARLARDAGLTMPEVAIYEGEANAFATGPTRNNSLVAVSTGLMQSMNEKEVEAVLAHEVSHIANGDMVTLTLIQGVVNTFVFFIARVIGYLVDSFLRKGEEDTGPGIGYMVTVIACDIVFGVLASMVVAWFSRQREFRADAGAAQLMRDNPQPMISALQRLGGMHPEPLPSNMAASGIAGGGSWMALLASHPPIEARIAALQARR